MCGTPDILELALFYLVSSLNSARHNEMWINLKQYNNNSIYSKIFIILLNKNSMTAMLKLLHLKEASVHFKKMLTFAQYLDKAHKVGSFARAQDLAQGPDVVLCKAQCLYLWQFLCFGVTRDNLPETLQSII